MYFVLGVCLCAAVVLLVSTACSVLVAAMSPLLKWMVRSAPAPIRAQFVFLVRMLPALAGVLVTFFLVVPAFLLHEPVHTNERVGLPLMVLAALGLAIFLGSAYRSVRAWMRLGRLKRHWMRTARKLSPDQKGIEIFQVSDPSALIVVTGIFKPTVFLSEPVVSCLTESESSAAIAHELAHVSAGDNLKQLLLQATKLPFFDRIAGLDREWKLVSELAADALAMRAGTPVLELASALVKVARLRVVRPVLPEAAVSYFLPPGKDSMLSARVEHLKALLEKSESVQPASRVSPVQILGIAILVAVSSMLLAHPNVFVLTHELLEKLV